MTTVKRGRGKPKGSKNKPKTDNQPKRKRGRPKGSKNKPKIDTTPKKRGRPRKNPIGSIKFANFEGVSLTKRKPGPQSDTHRWVAVIDNQVIGYFKTPEEAHKAYKDELRTETKEQIRKSKRRSKAK